MCRTLIAFVNFSKQENHKFYRARVLTYHNNVYNKVSRVYKSSMIPTCTKIGIIIFKLKKIVLYIYHSYVSKYAWLLDTFLKDITGLRGFQDTYQSWKVGSNLCGDNVTLI